MRCLHRSLLLYSINNVRPSGLCKDNMDNKTKELLANMKKRKVWLVNQKHSDVDPIDVYFVKQAVANKYFESCKAESKTALAEVACYRDTAGKFFVLSNGNLLPISVKFW